MRTNTETEVPDVLPVAGEMGDRILALDWNRTSLGPIGNWSASLRTTVSLLLNSRFPMLLWWSEDYICIYNDAYIPILGVKHPRSLGQPVRDVWSEIWHVLQPLIDTPFRGGPSTWMDDICLIINRNNYQEETHFTVAYSPAPDTTVPGGIGGVLATVIETTAQVINERSLETLRKVSSYLMGCQSETEVLTKAVESIGENKSDFPFVWIYDVDDHQKQAQLVATSAIAASDSLAPDRIVPPTGNAPFDFVFRAVETKEPVIITDLAARFGPIPKGSWDQSPSQAIAIPVILQGHQTATAVMIAALNPYRRPDDQYLSFIRLVTDQIVQALANATMIESERQRAEAIAALDKAKTLFFSNISHEFRTPITLMLGPLEELLNKPPMEWDAAKRSVETAYRNTLRLLKLVNTLLDFSRIESGRAEARYVPTDMAAYSRNLAENFRSATEKAGLRLEVNTESGMKPVYLDESMWEKIVFNLLSNAFKYTLEGCIKVGVLTEGDHAVLQVSDTGVGIPAEELAHVFDRFHRVLNTGGRTFEGTGIGLSLIRELVQLHGGTISLDSKKDIGSTFTIRIPFGKAHLPVAGVVEAAADIDRFTLTEYIEEVESLLPAHEPDSRPVKEGSEGDPDQTVLIVDDNADMRRHIQSVIGDHYPTIMAANGSEALALIAKARPAVVLSDLMMPVMDGAQLLRELRQNPATAQIPVILITARAGEESLVEGLEMGADDYIIKPFSRKELMSRIRAQLRVSSLRNQAYNQMKSFSELLEKEVVARTQDLVRLNKELESYSYVTSHDLQEPLRKIQIFIDRIVSEKEPPEPLLQKITESAARMRQLIQSMLLYSRLSQSEEEWKDVELGVVLSDVCRDYELVTEEKKAIIRIGKLPFVRGNQFQINQLFSNLLSNALKFSADAPEISVTADIVTEDRIPVADVPRTGRQFAHIRFCDNGIGFERQYSKKIFDLFQRLHSKHHYSGTGIGLSIAKKIVDQHNGYITAEPGDQNGATFHIWLPVN